MTPPTSMAAALRNMPSMSSTAQPFVPRNSSPAAVPGFMGQRGPGKGNVLRSPISTQQPLPQGQPLLQGQPQQGPTGQQQTPPQQQQQQQQQATQQALTQQLQQHLHAQLHAQLQQQQLDHSLPEGDDLLGMSAHGPADGSASPLLAAAAAAAAAGAAHSDGISSILERMASQSHAQASRPSPAQQTQPPAQQTGAQHGRGQAYAAQPHLLSHRGGRGRGVGPIGRNIAMYGRSRGKGRGQGSGQGGTNSLAPARVQQQAQFVSDRLRQELQTRSYLIQAQVNPMTENFGLPEILQHYHSLYPLEDLAQAEEQPSQVFGLCTSVVKAISMGGDGQAVALRRLSGRQLPPSAELLAAAQDVVEQWAVVAQHPGLVCPRQAFVSQELEFAPCLVFAHEYQPAAYTLEQAHMHPHSTNAGLMRNAPSEEQLWSYLTQLASALRVVHCAGLAVRTGSLMPSKVLLTSHATGRIRIGSLGILNTLQQDHGVLEEVQRLQQDDIAAVGHLMVMLAASAGAVPSLQHVAAHFTEQFASVLGSIEAGHIRDWHTLCSVLHEHAFEQLDRQAMHNDTLVGQLSRELENGRLLRLACRLAMVCERSTEEDLEAQWSETGDRYLLKLFRDFVFHQVTEEGAPVLEWGHVVEALNKLDAGVPEKVVLMSRDEASMMVVSYADLRRCLDSAYTELKTRANAAKRNRLGHHR